MQHQPSQISEGEAWLVRVDEGSLLAGWRDGSCLEVTGGSILATVSRSLPVPCAEGVGFLGEVT
jgi:hypothetical protein